MRTKLLLYFSKDVVLTWWLRLLSVLMDGRSHIRIFVGYFCVRKGTFWEFKVAKKCRFVSTDGQTDGRV